MEAEHGPVDDEEVPQSLLGLRDDRPPHSILLDAKALSALTRDDGSMQAWARFAKRSDSAT